MGFEGEMALQACFGCEKNKEAAINFLIESDEREAIEEVELN